MGLASNIASTAGAISSGVGAFYSAKAAKAQFGLDAELSKINARLADQASRDALLKGEQAYGRSRLRTAATKGSQRAAMGANGVDMTFGTPLTLLTATDLVGEQDADTIKANAMREAMGYKIDASNARGRAAAAKASASGISAFGSAFTSLMSNAGTVARGWFDSYKDGSLGSSGRPKVSSGGR